MVSMPKAETQFKQTQLFAQIERTDKKIFAISLVDVRILNSLSNRPMPFHSIGFDMRLRCVECDAQSDMSESN